MMTFIRTMLQSAILVLAGISCSPSQASDHLTDRALIHADIVALDQVIVYNRFGSFDPYGMIFALKRDVSEATDLGDTKAAAECATKTGIEPGTGALEAGKVRLKDCKRPRPLVLRARVGDVLRVNVTNLLRPVQPGVSETFCKTGAGSGGLPNIGDIRAKVSTYPTLGDGTPLCDSPSVAGGPVDQSGVASDGEAADWPRTRGLSFVIPGLEPIPTPGSTRIPDFCKGLGSIAPNENETCYFRLDREGTHLFQSLAAAAGGEGDGGSLTHGLFGALIVEPAGSNFYRSQVPMQAFDAVWARKANAPVHARESTPAYDKTLDAPTPATHVSDGNRCASVGAVPVANMLRDCGISEELTLGGATLNLPVRELVHSDINAIIVPPVEAAAAAAATPSPYEGDKPIAEPFREFVVIFHDELKSYYTKEFEGLANFEQFSGVRDGFAINYGASGAGSLILANRKKIGPAANCAECMYEEFFLESWANGDPALLENFVDDPSNVHHSYLNDRVVFRNFHAGPKETHVFHLHSHQWYAGNDKNRGAYLDSQTIGPQQGMSYDIYGGGTQIYRPGIGEDGKLGKGWYDTLGSGNRNRTPGDAIFHCHLYPHFAQGMWELWRVHDVLEDGTRTLPDGQKTPGLSFAPRDASERKLIRAGTPTSGNPVLWSGDLANYSAEGTPIPGLLPVPRQAAPLLPTYDAERGFPGYPFYIAGVPGHRTPQAPMDIAVEDGKRLDGGLGRHVLLDGTRISDVAAGPKSGWAEAGIEDKNGVPYYEGKIVPVTVAQKLALADLTETYAKLSVRVLPPDGTKLERRAMAFHHQGLIEGDKVDPAKRLLLRRSDGTEIVNLPGLAQSPLPDIPPQPAAGASAQEQQAYETAVAANSQARGYESVFLPEAPAATPPSPLPVALFGVNGAPPKPGAPFADPCGAPDSLRNSKLRNPRGDSDGEESVALTGRPVFARGKLVGGLDKFGDDILDPSYPPKDMTYDPALSGFRRFAASVVQFDMIVNKAGWHDPQARINVLTRLSDLYKPGGERAVSGREEPFYFRAFSGDCIEFRHTNETPHKLDLDDFQAKVPTDTIGQHIHLVKFDVTSSDGSGNGWNYEDGTFAPDELKERIHAANRQEEAAAGTGWSVHPDNASFAGKPTNFIDLSSFKASVAEESEWAQTCGGEEPTWKLKRQEGNNRICFQTTVQRWFADPILSRTGDPDPTGISDRTLRTVFTHDHFAPSNIQQHGFYNALLIEPISKDASVYSADRTKTLPMLMASFAPWKDIGGGVIEPVLVDAFKPATSATATASAGVDSTAMVAAAIVDADPKCDIRSNQVIPYDTPTRLEKCNFSDNGVGARALLEERLFGAVPSKRVSDPLHPNYREFALAIADFALLYDGRKSSSAPKAVTELDGEGEANGLDRMIGEALLDYGAKVSELYRDQAGDAKAANICEHNRGRLASAGGEGRSIDGLETLPPAQAVACEIVESARSQTASGWLVAAAEQLRKSYFEPIRTSHGKPVYPPTRPEAISQTHHDPYLVNYRNEPIPLRVGETSSATDLLANRACPDFVGSREEAKASADSVRRQKRGEGGGFDSGDMARAFRTAEHGDPCTPVLESYDGERIMVRLIQGAQEVQHVFTVEGRQFRRNVDQIFAFGARLDAEKSKGKGPTRWNDCMRAAERARPAEFQRWFGPGGEGDPSEEWLESYRTISAECDNIAGYVTAQEIGISEHFEFAGPLSSSSGAMAEMRFDAFRALDALRVRKAGALPLRDSLYHFGTVDALWNGGWGLFRTYGNKTSPDTTKCLASVEKGTPQDRRDGCLLPSAIANDDEISDIGERLQPLKRDAVEQAEVTADAEQRIARDKLSAARREVADASLLPTYPDLSCPFIDPSEAQAGDNPVSLSNSKHVFAAVAAFETRFLNSGGPLGGTVYDSRNGLYDPDGLAFVALDPARLGIGGASATDVATTILRQERIGAVDDTGSFGTVNWNNLLKAAKDKVAQRGLEPYVQRFNAGDCIHLVVVNGLTEMKLPGAVYGDLVGNNRAGLRDRPGDAFLPRITRLNNDQIKDGQSDAQDSGIGEITPSASLAVSLPLSQMTNINDAPEPIGANPRLALRPASIGGGAPYTILTFYAGTVGVKAADLDSVLVNVDLSSDADKLEPGSQAILGIPPDQPLCSFEQALDGQTKQFGYAVWPSADFACGSYEDGQIELNVLGRRYCAMTMKLEEDGTGVNYKPAPASVKPDHARLQACARQAVSNVARKMDIAEYQEVEPGAAPDDVRLKLPVVPHAFGTLPFKSTSDPISHGPHGLAGIVIVEPKSATYSKAADGTATVTEVSQPGDAPSGKMRVPYEGLDELALINPSWVSVDRGEAAQGPQSVVKVQDIPLTAIPGMPDYPADALGKADLHETALLWQDGLNLWDGKRRPFYVGGCVLGSPGCSDANDSSMRKRIGGPVPDCLICDDSYDRGEKGVSYGTTALFARLRDKSPIPPTIGPQDWSSQSGVPIYHGGTALEADGSQSIVKTSDLSSWPLPPALFKRSFEDVSTPLVTAPPSAQMMVRMVEPQGRARQRAFVPTGASYQDIFPGFGSGHSTLIAPGKGITAAMEAPDTPGDYLWFDGPRQLLDGGTWGLMCIASDSQACRSLAHEN